MKNILILVDIQNEYITKGRPFYLNGIESSLQRCRDLLSHARDNSWEIVHVQHSNGEGSIKFNPETPYYEFVKGFEPKTGELHCVKNDFSCYSSVKFSKYLDSINNSTDCNVYLIGYNSVMCCLSTLEEARRKNHKINFISDASYAKSLPGFSELESHKFMVELYKTKGLADCIYSNDILNKCISHNKN